MRFLSAMLAAFLLTVPAWAESPPAEDPPATPRQRTTWQQKFAQANTTHDGHLTLEQAVAGYLSLARHFSEIDRDAKGYITVEDVTTWRKAQKDSKQGTRAAADDPMRPRNAYQRSFPQQRPAPAIPVGTSMTNAAAASGIAAPGDGQEAKSQEP